MKGNVTTNDNSTCGYTREFKRLPEPGEKYQFSKLKSIVIKI